MSEPKNEFFWSKSRHELFNTCPRQYWFFYYGCWKGWLEGASERTRQIYVLTKLKNRHRWAEEKIRESIQKSLNRLRKGTKLLRVDDIVSITLDQMRAEFRSSKSKAYWKNPKSWGLLEHEYELEVSDEEWKELAGNVEACLRNFYASDIYDGLKSHRKEGWLEVEESSSFFLDHTKINLVIDCAIKEGEGIYIYEWKTGRILPEDRSIPFGCYALYAMERWNVSFESVNVIEHNLPFGKSSWFSVSQDEIEEVRSYLSGSIKDMRSLLMDVSNNIPMEEDRFRRIDDEALSSTCHFRRVCRK